MWIRVLLITLLITSLAFVQAKRKQPQTKSTQQPKIQAKKLPTKTITKPKQALPQPKIEKPLWLLSVVWPAGYCQKANCNSAYINNWDHQSFLINGLTEVDRKARKTGEKLELNLTQFKNQNQDTLRQNLKNYFPPNLEETKSKKFSPEAWIKQWATNGNHFGIKHQNKYFEELVAIYKSLKGLQKITNVVNNEVKSKKDLAKLLGLQQNSFSVDCKKVNKNTVLSQIQICLTLKNNSFIVTKCNAKQLKTQCSFPLKLSGLNQKWTKQQKWRNTSLITNYHVDPQYDFASPFKNIVEKPIKLVQNKTLTVSNKTADNKIKQQKTLNAPSKKQSKSATPKSDSKQKKNCKKTVFKSKQVSGKVQLNWLLGQCYEFNLRNLDNQCQWDQIMFWDHQSFVINGLQTYPNQKLYKNQIKALKKIILKKEIKLDNLFNQTQQANLQQIWPKSIVEDENLWQLSWKNHDNGIDFLITLKEILPHLFTINNETDFSQFQREYFEITQEYYNSLKKLQKLPKSSYTLQQLAKLIGISSKSLSIQCAHTKKEKTNFLTSLDICVKLFSKDNQTISIKTSECKSKQKYQGCSLGKNKQVNLLFWRNKSNETDPYWGHKYIKVIIPASKFVQLQEESQLSQKQDSAASSQSPKNNQTNSLNAEPEANQENQQQKEEVLIEENNVQSNTTSTNQNLTESIVKETANPEVQQDESDDQNQQEQEKDHKQSAEQVKKAEQEAETTEDDSIEQAEQNKQLENSQTSAQASREQKLSQIQL